MSRWTIELRTAATGGGAVTTELCTFVTERASEEVLRRGVVLGSVLASFAVETFGVQRMRSLTWENVMRRFEHMRALTHFEEFDKEMIAAVDAT